MLVTLTTNLSGFFFRLAKVCTKCNSTTDEDYTHNDPLSNIIILEDEIHFCNRIHGIFERVIDSSVRDGAAVHSPF